MSETKSKQNEVKLTDEEKKQKMKLYQKAYREKNKEKLKAYYQDNKDKHKQYSKKYFQENKEKCEARRRKNYYLNKLKNNPDFKLKVKNLYEFSDDEIKLKLKEYLDIEI